MCTSSMTGSTTESMRNGNARRGCLWGRTGFVLLGMLASLSMMGLEVKAQTILRVDADRSCTTIDAGCELSCGDDTDWDNAFGSLQDALTQASNCGGAVDIRVANGTYKPAGSGGSRSATFSMIDEVSLYGG